MSSKRAIRRKACESKRSYPDESSAAAAARAVYRRTDGQERLGWYRCQFCGSWHIGHRPAWLMQAIRDRRG